MTNYVYRAEKALHFPWGFFPAGSYFPTSGKYKYFDKYFTKVEYNEYFKNLTAKTDKKNLAKENGKFIIPAGLIVKLANRIAISRTFPQATRIEDAPIVCQFCAGGKNCKLKKVAKCCNNATQGTQGFVWFETLSEQQIVQRADIDFSDIIP